MAISVKDIQEKEFSTQKLDGYNVEQVDDYLDELAEELSRLVRENLALTSRVKELEEQKTELENRKPDYNEGDYFKNLENAMRESLVGAQRIADETVANANTRAQQTIDDANAQAEKTLADANAQADAITEGAKKAVAEMNAEAERLQGVVNAYRNNFKKLLDEQLSALHASDALLK